MSAKIKGYHVIQISFKSPLGKEIRYNCAKSHHCRICVTNFRGNPKKVYPEIFQQPYGHF